MRCPIPLYFTSLPPPPPLSLCLSLCLCRLGGLVVKASASEARNPVFESRLRGDFSGSSHTSDFKIGTPVATLARRLALEGRHWDWSGLVSVYCDWGEVESLICNFYLSVAARKPCLCRSGPEIHKHVAGALSNQPTNNQSLPLCQCLSLSLFLCRCVCYSLSLSVCLSLSVSVHSLSVSVCLSLSLSLSLSVSVSVCLPVCLSVCLPACLSVCL